MSTSTRSRPDSPPVDDSAPHELFADAKNDGLLVSADKQSFPFRRPYLEVASEVFEDMFGAGRAEGGRKRSRSGLDVIQLAEEGVVLKTFLRFLHPRLKNPRLETVKLVER